MALMNQSGAGRWKIGMPNLGHTMEEGKVSDWLKAVGDPVHQGEVILVVETDKASFDVESPADGTLGAIYAAVGTVVPVGQAVGEVLEAGATLAEAKVAPALAASPVPAVGDAPTASDAKAASAVRGRKPASPAARVLAEENGIDLQAITGTGDDGLVTRDDVRAAIAARAQAPGTPLPVPQPLSAMRRAIADATQQAWREVPHVPLHGHADVDALLASPAGTAGLTAAITRACALALRQHGSFNGCLAQHVFTPAAQADIALAVSTPDGLVTAVVRQAESGPLAALAAQIRDLAERARAGRLDGARMTGGSFAISTLGRWGVDAFVPIIQVPQVAILGVGAVRRVAREGAQGAVHFVSELSLTLVFDHRANDGVAAAGLLAAIVSHLEHPQTLEPAP